MSAVNYFVSLQNILFCNFACAMALSVHPGLLFFVSRLRRTNWSPIEPVAQPEWGRRSHAPPPRNKLAEIFNGVLLISVRKTSVSDDTDWPLPIKIIGCATGSNYLCAVAPVHWMTTCAGGPGHGEEGLRSSEVCAHRTPRQTGSAVAGADEQGNAQLRRRRAADRAARSRQQENGRCWTLASSLLCPEKFVLSI